MGEKTSAASTLEKAFDYQAYLRQKLEKTLFSRCADEDGSFYAAKIVANLDTLLETAAKTLETDFEEAASDFIAVPSEEMERCKSFILALSRAKEQLGLSPLSNIEEMNAWLDYSIEEAREIQQRYEFDDDEIPTGENGEPLCSDLYLDELACEVFGNICFEFNGSETYFANHIAATAERIVKQMTDDLNNGVIPNGDIILSFVTVFEEISSHVPADMIQLETDEYEELDESDPDYAEKHNLLLEAFTDMDKDAHYTGINNGIFMGTLTGPNIRVESMTITAYESTPSYNLTYAGFKAYAEKTLDGAHEKLEKAFADILESDKAYNRAASKSDTLTKARHKDASAIANQVYNVRGSLVTARTEYESSFDKWAKAQNGYDAWKNNPANRTVFVQPGKLTTDIFVAGNAAASMKSNADKLHTSAITAETAVDVALGYVKGEEKTSEEVKKTDLTEEQIKFIATVAGEALGTNETEWKACASVIMNRKKHREWASQSISQILNHGAFNAVGESLFNDTKKYLETGIWDNIVNRNACDKLIPVVLPIYNNGGSSDYARGAVFFNTDGPNRYTGTEVSISGVAKHRFFLHICPSNCKV